MAFDDCIKSVRDAAPDLTDDQIEKIFEELQRIRDDLRAREGLSEVEDMMEAADFFSNQIEAAAMIEKRNRLINKIREAEVFDHAVKTFEATGNLADALQSITVGIKRNITDGRNSIDARARALSGQYSGRLIGKLKEDDLFDFFLSGSMDLDIAKELEQLSKVTGSPGISKNRQALAIAKIIDPLRKEAIARVNRAGGWIRLLDGYVTTQTHDQVRIRRAGFEAWRDFISARIDDKRTLAGVTDVDDFYRSVYNHLASGQFMKYDGGQASDLQFAFKGPGNLAKRAAQHRILHFRDAEAWFEYNQKFGATSLRDAIVGELERHAHNTALMERLGTNPEAMFNKIRDRLIEKYQDQPDQIQKIAPRKFQDQYFKQVNGELNIPVSPSLARWTGTVRAFQGMAKLGGAFLSALGPDSGFAAREFQRHGARALESYGKALEAASSMFDSRERKIFGDYLGAGLEGQLGDIHLRWQMEDGLPGWASNLQRIFFKLNLLGPWTDGNKRGVAMIFSRDLARNKGKSFNQLEELTREWLDRFGIGEHAWDVLRKHAIRKFEGREYILPDLVQEVPDEVIENFLAMRPPKLGGSKLERVKPKTEAARQRLIKQTKDELELSIRNFYIDRTESAIPTPGGQEAAIMKAGTLPGTVSGEAVRFMMQFKAFPTTIITKQFGQDIFGRGKADILGLAHMVAITTVMGYLALSAKDMFKGKTQRDPLNYNTWIQALTQGGGAGIYGDFIFGEYNRFGRSPTATLAGPTFGSIDSIMEIWASLLRGEDAGAKSARFLMNNAPFMNLFYTRPALDYLVLYQLQESINPGYLRRMERRIQRDQSQEFGNFLLPPPSSAIPAGGGGRFFEGVR